MFLRKSSSPWFPGVVSLVVGLMTMSCASFGPNKLHSSHLNYNKAVQQAQMEEDLLNIVRLRYLDTPVSLSVSSISAQASFSVGTGGEFGLVEGNSSANITPGIGYTDRPTFTFTPFGGREFLDAMASPIPMETLVNLSVSQAGFDVLLRIAVANLNGIRNRFDGASPDFDRLAAKIRALQNQDDLAAGFLSRTVTLSEPISADSVEYRDHWFFILDSDHASKRTFGLLQALFLSLVTKDPGQGAPVLTLPLN